MASEYPLLSQKTVKMPQLFGTAYLCETAFLTLTNSDLGLDKVNYVYLRQKYHQELTIYAKQGNHIPLTKFYYTVKIVDVIFMGFLW